MVIGIRKNFNKLADDDLPSISIIVAARNEEDNILECMQSLEKLIYPSGKMEIILVNDHSNDATGGIIETFIKDKPQFKYLIPSEAIVSRGGKANAIANAIRIASGKVILTTDADCTVLPTWAKSIAQYYTDNVAIVCGYTTQVDKDSFGAMQAIDFIYLLEVAAGTINLGKPLSCIGNNMSYRKDVYEEVGGYEGIPFSVTEDSRLMVSIDELKKYRIIYPLEEQALVTSKPCSTFKELYRQKKRWGAGGKESGLIGYAVMGSGFLSHIAILLIPFFFSMVSIYLLLFKLVIDYYFILPVYQRLKLKLNFKHFLVFEMYFVIYVVLLPFIVLFDKKVQWKGREFK